jgi:hypothetical protein
MKRTTSFYKVDSELEGIARHLRNNGIFCARSGSSYLILDRRDRDDKERMFDTIGELQGSDGHYFLRIERRFRSFPFDRLEKIIRKYSERKEEITIEMESLLI